MAADLSNLIVEVLHYRSDDTDPGWSVGSGFFVSRSLVLTAFHNVDGQGELLVRVHGTEEYPAEVRLQGNDTMDLAVLEVPGMEVDVPPLRYGVVDRSTPALVKQCWAIGFPHYKVLKGEPNKPKPPPSTDHVSGEIPTGANLYQQLLTLKIRDSTPRSQLQGSEWAGMSGAVVFSGDYIVVGVITEHHLPEGESALIVVPITAIDLLPKTEAAKWWQLLGVDHYPLVRLPGEAPSLLSPVERKNRRNLIKRVQATWIEGVLEHSLYQAALIALNLQEQPDALANPWRLEVQETDLPPCHLPAGTPLVQVYDEAEGELLILGEPGAGKTTLLLELARVLLNRAQVDERHPIPTVFHLSSWAKKRLPLSEWLVEELETRYQVPRKVGRSWVTSGQLLPLLDGLDEVAEDARPGCVQAVNDYQREMEQGSTLLVVCCRSQEYKALSTPVTLHQAVSIQPLTKEQIEHYLQRAGGQVEALRQALQDDADLYMLARRPLMLNIFTLAYQEADPKDLLTQGTREAMPQRVFAAYVERMLRRRAVSKQFRREQISHWLIYLAQQMRAHQQKIFSLEQLQPDWLSKQQRVMYRGSIALIVGLVMSLLGSQFLGPIGLFFGLSIGIVTGSILGSTAEIKPAEALSWSWKDLRSGLIFVLKLGFVIVLSIGLFVGLGQGTVQVFKPGILSVILLLLLIRTMLFNGLLGKQLPEQKKLSPNEGIRRSIKNGLLMPVVGLIAGLVIGLSLGSVYGLVTGLFYGLFTGLVYGLGSGLDAALQHYTLRFWLWRTGFLPWNLVVFLDEAAERLLLSKVGGSYMFAHGLLLDYFASSGKREVSDQNSELQKKREPPIKERLLNHRRRRISRKYKYRRIDSP
jgi:eukaryotic-like serine/threonine-protein kinase